MSDHPYGWLSLAPPVLAIVLAIVTRRVILSLAAGVLCGALIVARGNPVRAIGNALDQQLWATLVDENKLYVFAFTSLMGAMVGVINRSGGMRGLVDVVSPWARNRRRGQLTTWVLGLFVFFDDYANTVLLGTTLRPLSDRLKISREKLAYLVDSTSAPVAGLALISTWVAGEIEFVQEGIDKVPAGVGWNAFELFLSSIPYRFYVIWALLFVPAIALLRRDFGPMFRAEQRCVRATRRDAGKDGLAHDDPAFSADAPARWYNAVIPIGVTVLAVMWFLYSSGRASIVAVNPTAVPSLREVFGASDSYSSLLWGALAGVATAVVLARVQRLLSAGETFSAAAGGARLMLPALAILWLASSLSTLTGNSPSRADRRELEINRAAARATAATLARGNGTPAQVVDALVAAGLPAVDSVAMFVTAERPLVDLVDELAGRGVASGEIEKALLAADVPRENVERLTTQAAGKKASATVDRERFTYRSYRLYTGAYLSQLLQGNLPRAILPTLIFVLAAGISFATGTSWGTMGIVMPLAIPLTYGVLHASSGLVAADDPILLASVGSVLAGSIFGDHCSPISDTTVLSSQASGCDHVAHVWTQMPYALLVGTGTVLLGTLPIGFGAPVWFVLPAGIVVLIVVLRVVGRRVDDDAP